MRSHWRELALILVAAAIWGFLANRPTSQPVFETTMPQLSKTIPLMADPDLVAGQVVSGMNGQPLHRARVVGWGASRKVDAGGRFSFPAHQKVSLLIEAPYFERQKVTLEPGRPQVIRLLPASPLD